MNDLSQYLDRVTCGDALEVLRELPADSVHCCVTSPPYWGLRDYGVDGQMGLEATPEAYVEGMVAVFGEVRRVLRGDGTLWLNVGDSYASGGRDEYDADQKCPKREGRHRLRTSVSNGLKPKDLCMIPARLALALQADGWYLRSDIIWHKPNPMPESVRDRPTKSHEYVFMLSKSQRYFWDQEAVRESAADTKGTVRFSSRRAAASPGAQEATGNEGRGSSEQDPRKTHRNTRDVWTIATSPCPEAHFAVMPQRLVEPCIKAGTSERGCCPECGAPWQRMVERTAATPGQKQGYARDCTRRNDGERAGGWTDASATTLGWRPTCTCDTGDPAPCVVLDPFMGAGTVGLVAQTIGRHFIGIELNPEYCAIAERRIADALRKHQPALNLQEVGT